MSSIQPSPANISAALDTPAVIHDVSQIKEEAEAPAHQPQPVIKTTMFNGWNATMQMHQAPAVTVKFNPGPWGKTNPQTHHCLLLPEGDAEKKLIKNQKQLAFNRAGNPLWRLDTNFLASNALMEDAHAFDTFSKRDLPLLLAGSSFWEQWYKLQTLVLGDDARIQSKAGDGGKDLIMASVFDGHAGPQVGELCSKALHACISRAIAKDLAEGGKKDHGAILMDSIEAFDNDLTQMPAALANGSLKSPFENPLLPNPPPSLFSMRSIDNGSGACGITAVVDVENADVWVANLGDCRCVAGFYDTSTDTWRCDVLSRDMTCDDPEEAAAVRNILGHVSRGDFLGVHVSPPYLPTKPEVMHRKIRSDDGKEQLKFLILGVDGIFDRLTSEEATLLLAGHLTHPEHPSIARADLPRQLKLAPPPAQRPWPQQPLPGSPERGEGVWHFQDLNAATHLMRNSIAGFGDPQVRRAVLSLVEPASRQIRDDMTAMCVVPTPYCTPASHSG